MQDLELIKNLTWPQVYKIWQDLESNSKKWKKLYIKQGFASWQQWRDKYIKPLDLENLDWQLFKIEDINQIDNYYGGPFKKWQQYIYKNENSLNFRELAKQDDIKNNKTINQIINNFPEQTTIIGVKLEDKIYIIDGMHRCCALALDKNLKTNIKIALAEYNKFNLPTV